MKKAALAVRTRPHATIKVRVALYTRMYEIAKEHRDLANYVVGKDRRIEIKESMIAILFAYTCLEAYINAIGIDRLGTDWQRYSWDPLDKKWKRVSRWLTSKKYGRTHSVFYKREEPFKSFLDLKKIREEHLVHWKAQALSLPAVQQCPRLLRYPPCNGNIPVSNETSV